MAEALPDFDSLVRKRFAVKDSFQLAEGEVEYKVEYSPESKVNFGALVRELGPLGCTPWLLGSKDDCALVVRKKQVPRRPVSSIPVLLALFTVASVIAFGILDVIVYDDFAPIVPSYVVLPTYCACVLAVLAAHEFGHRYVAEKQGSDSHNPYFIPGIPVITGYLPSLGVFSTLRGPVVNRDTLFDISIFGPLAAFGVTIVLFVLGEFVSVQSSIPFTGNQVINGFTLVKINPSVVQAALDSFLSPLLQHVSPGYIRLSPVNDATDIGFLLTFLMLLPLPFFDGGYLGSAVLGEEGSRIAAYLGVLALVVIDTPTYWAPAILILLISGRQQPPKFLDEVSAPSSSKKLALVLAILLAFLCLPVPQNLATFPLP